MNKKDAVVYLILLFLIALAFFLRFYRLDERVFHHDEAAVGYFAYKLFNDGIYSYNPSFHGPFMYYATAEMFRRFGDSEYSARLLPAILGTGMLFLLIPLRRYIGKNGMLVSAFFLALSPSFLYYSRFYREDIFMSFFSLLFLVSAVKYIERRNSEERYSLSRFSYVLLGAAALASMAAIKENAYIITALIVFFLGLLFMKNRWYRGLITRIKNRDERTVITAVEVIVFILLALVYFSLFYSGKVLDVEGMKAALEKAVSHWYEMHRIQRIGGPWFFYLPIMALYELPVLVFGIAGIVHYWKKNNLFMTFLGYWAMSNLIVYSYFQEKVPWLILNPLLPFTIIAGTYLGELLPRIRSNSRIGAAAVIFLIVSSSYFVYSSAFLNFSDHTNPAEPLIQAAQPPQRFSEFLDTIFEVSSQYQNQSTEIQVTDDGIETQFLWYLRHYGSIKWRVSIDSELNAPIVVVHDTDGDSEADRVQRNLSVDYMRLDSAKMSWYFFKPSDVTLDYLLYRKMDRPPGEYRVALFYRPKT